MYDETLTGPRELPAYPHHLRGSLTKRGRRYSRGDYGGLL